MTIDDVRHIEGLDEVDDIRKIDKTYELSEIELTDRQRQQIIDERSVTITSKLEIGSWRTVAFTTDNGAYTANVKTIYPNMPWIEMIMTLVSFILFCCVFLIHEMIDNRNWSLTTVICLCCSGGADLIGIFCSLGFFTLIILI